VIDHSIVIRSASERLATALPPAPWLASVVFRTSKERYNSFILIRSILFEHPSSVEDLMAYRKLKCVCHAVDRHIALAYPRGPRPSRRPYFKALDALSPDREHALAKGGLKGELKEWTDNLLSAATIDDVFGR